MPPPHLPNGTTNSFAMEDSSPSASTIYHASSLASIRDSLSALHTHDAAITTRLQTLLTTQADLSRDLGRLDLLRAHLGTQALHTRTISTSMLTTASTTASTLSTAVRRLDLEKHRVEATLHVVEQVAELKACVQGIVGSMGAPQDWEAAAGYIARADKIPKEIVEGKFAARIVPSVEVPDTPGITVENAKESLCGLFLREFEKAAGDGDGGRITRFFKLFPLIGREETGLDVYGRYVCQGVAGTARRNLREGLVGVKKDEGAGNTEAARFFYANVLTKLFEHIAQIVEGHGSLVERHYGKGRMVRVIERLQVEADVQGGIVLDTWGDERSVDRRLTDVKSYPFSFLVQSFLPVQKSSGISRTNSPAVGGATNGRASEDEGVDMKEVDGLLSETAVMLGRWSLYSRFLAGKCRDVDTSPDEPLIVPDFILKSALSKKISARLINPFNTMTTFFFRRSVEKAFQLDEPPTGLSLHMSKPLDGNPPYIISAVDDVMYIVNTVLTRTLSTSQRDVVASVVPTIGRVLGSDFVGMIQRKMRDESYPRPVIQGGYPPEDKIIAFIVLINSLDVANEYLARIVTSRLTPPEPPPGSKPTSAPNPLTEQFPFSHDALFVRTSLSTLQSTFTTKSTELLTDGLHVLFNQVVKPRLRPVLTDTFRDIDYTLSTSDITNLTSVPSSSGLDPDDDPLLSPDLVPRRFSHAWDALMRPLQRIMTKTVYAQTLDQTARYLAKVLEKRIWVLGNGRVSVDGAGRLERDFAGMVEVVGRGEGRYRVREGFARVRQLLVVVGMEEEEWEEVRGQSRAGDGGDEDGGEGEGEIEWILSEAERNKARALLKL